MRFAVTQAPRNGDATVDAAVESSYQGFADAYFTANSTTGLYKVTATTDWAPGANASFDETVDAAAPMAFDPGKLLGVMGCGAGSAAGLGSVNFATGNNFKVDEDYAAAGPLNPVRFVRYYNSLDTRAGVLGKSWRHHYERSVTIKTTKGKAPTTVATVARPEGSVLTYTLTNGQWVGDPDVTARLESVGGGFRYTCDSDNVEEYDGDGKLLSISLRGVRATQFLTYDTSGRVATVADAGGRVLRFRYDKSKRVSGVTDPSGNEYQFTYSSNNELVSVVGPDLYRRTFLYYEGLLYSSRTGDAVEVDGFHEDQYAYDLQRRVGQAHTQAGSVTVRYFDGGSREVVTQDVGSRRYTYSAMHGSAKLLAIDQTACSGCATVRMETSYGGTGLMIGAINGSGVRTYYTRDARGLELSRTEAAGTSSERTTTTTWHHLASGLSASPLDRPARPAHDLRLRFEGPRAEQNGDGYHHGCLPNLDLHVRRVGTQDQRGRPSNRRDGCDPLRIRQRGKPVEGDERLRSHHAPHIA